MIHELLRAERIVLDARRPFSQVLEDLSNPLVLAGIAFELAFCWLLFYTPLSSIYFFEPLPWHVYLFAFHGTLLLLLFEEIRKYYRRCGGAV